MSDEQKLAFFSSLIVGTPAEAEHLKSVDFSNPALRVVIEKFADVVKKEQINQMTRESVDVLLGKMPPASNEVELLRRWLQWAVERRNLSTKRNAARVTNESGVTRVGELQDKLA